MNDIANLCEIMGADVNMVRKGIGSDPRIGNRFIYPGIGYGGSCFPKDVKALIKTAKQNGYDMRILQSVEDVNDDQKSVLFGKIMNHFGGDIKGKHFGVWGLSFKPNTDDMREAPSVVLINKLLAEGATVTAFDPVAMHEATRDLGNTIVYAQDEYHAAQGADALCLVTEWSDFRVPQWDKVKAALKGHVLFDGRNLYDAEDVRERGFVYYGIGVK
jgi:UDPglucose 6-dehydrogenase